MKLLSFVLTVVAAAQAFGWQTTHTTSNPYILSLESVPNVGTYPYTYEGIYDSDSYGSGYPNGYDYDYVYFTEDIVTVTANTFVEIEYGIWDEVDVSAVATTYDADNSETVVSAWSALSEDNIDACSVAPYEVTGAHSGYYAASDLWYLSDEGWLIIDYVIKPGDGPAGQMVCDHGGGGIRFLVEAKLILSGY